MVTPKLSIQISPSNGEAIAGEGIITITESNGVHIQADASRSEVVIREKGNKVEIFFMDDSIMDDVRATITIKSEHYAPTTFGVVFKPNFKSAPRLNILLLTERFRSYALTLDTKMDSQERRQVLYDLNQKIGDLLEAYFPADRLTIKHPQNYPNTRKPL